jgi:hypothetical protein
VVAYPAMLDVARELVALLAGLLADERAARGTRTGARALSCGKQAVFALVWFRERRPVALTGKGWGISQATAYRYLDEAIEVLAARAPDLHEALARGHAEGWSHVVLDGKIIDTDRVRIKTLSTKGQVIDSWYSGKTHDFGGNIAALTRPDGLPVWVSPVEPGSVHDLTVARTHDALLRSLRALGERGFALLAERWRTLQHVTVSPSKISKIAQAALVLTHFEHGYLTR